MNHERCEGDDPAPAALWVVVLPEGGCLARVAPEGGDVLVHGVQLPLVDPQLTVGDLLLVPRGSGRCSQLS